MIIIVFLILAVSAFLAGCGIAALEEIIEEILEDW